MMAIGERMKHNYEMPYLYHLTRRVPVIIRLDGKSFHSYTRGCDKPFDEHLSRAMCLTATDLIKAIGGAKIAYTQSDEISILVTDYDDIYTDAWYDYNVQKLCSITASMCTALFNMYFRHPREIQTRLATFDSRVFNVPKEEVMNYFLWRQQDWIRNSVQMCAQHLYSPKELHKKNNEMMKEMIKERGMDWDLLSDMWKYGTFITRLSGACGGGIKESRSVKAGSPRLQSWEECPLILIL